MPKILITYFSESGSTKKAAEIISANFKQEKNFAITLSSVAYLNKIQGFDLIIIGTPNWYGKPVPQIQKFIKLNYLTLKNTKTAIFFTCMSLSTIQGSTFKNIKIFKDAFFNISPKPIKDMNMWEKSHTISFYLENIQKSTPEFRPNFLGFFKGNLNFNKLSFGHFLIMKIVTWMSKDVRVGNFLDAKMLEEWCKTLKEELIF